ncbi:MAG TPA: hypothetical protein VKS23_07835 [Thermoanaerobaculia bacterium]|nr:hypothetical protein [Thermoanaerobaculia bacterium]
MKKEAPGLAPVLGVVFGAAALRFAPFLAGGTLYRRDAGFFFVPWRLLLARFLRAGEAPLWNEWMSGGRAFAADPNAAVFWPLSPLLVVFSPTALALTNVLLALLVFFLASRRLGLSAIASGSGTLVLLFSGVFQSLPVYATTCAAVLPLSLALVEAARLDSEDPAVRRRACALAALAFGVSALGGEPAVTLIGAASFVAVSIGAGRASRVRATAAALFALVLGAGLAAVQILPAALEVARSARGAGMKPEHGALFWSVRPARVLTLVEPRLTGDPGGEASSYWGSATFDAGSPYFEDLALGLVPLLLAAAAWRDRRGRAALLLALAGAVLSFGRFLPGYSLLASALPFVRYPEKWWLLVTFALAAAAAIGVEAVFFGEAEARASARRTLLKTAVGMALVCAALFALAIGAEDFLRKVLWALKLGAGEASSAAVASALRSPLILGTLSLALIAAFTWLVARNRQPEPLFTFEEKLRSPLLLACVLGVLFFTDAARRVAGTCPAGPRDLYTKETPPVTLVRKEAGSGRFYDDGADDSPTAARRAREAGGLDRLRPTTGVVFGIHYAGENDVDRMTPAASVRFAREAAGLAWGEEKVERLRRLGVVIVRTPAAAPDPPGAVEVGRFGGDRIVRIARAREEFALLPAGGGRVTVTKRGANFTRLEVHVALPAAVLAVSRTFDPNWRARLDGKELALRPADGFLTAADVPKGDHEIVLRYRNPAFGAGGALSLASVLAVALLARPPRRP